MHEARSLAGCSRAVSCITTCNTIELNQGDFMASPLTLRLEKKTRQRIARIASRRRISSSEVIREAIEAWVERQEPIAAPYRAMADLIGVVNGRKPGRSAETGRRFREVLKSRRRRP